MHRYDKSKVRVRASGVIYGIKLLEALNELKIESGLVISDAGKTVIEDETNYEIILREGDILRHSRIFL